MRLAVVGVGDAGSRVVNQILALEKASGRNLCGGNTLLVNSTTPVFDAAEHVPEERRLTIGDVQWRVEDAGIDGDPDVAAEVAREEANEIIRAFDMIEFHEVDGVLVVAGLAGGTGGGAGAVVLDQLANICEEPVYAVGVLPAASEGQGPALNAARALQSFVSRADNVVAFDNDEWLGEEQADDEDAGVPAVEELEGADDEAAVSEEGDEAAASDEDATDVADVAGDVVGTGTLEERRERANAALAERLLTLFAAGEFGDGAASENRLDPSDVIRTLDTGGVSSIGYATIDLPPTGRLRSWLRALGARFTGAPADDGEDLTDAARINRLVRRAARSTLTLPCAVSSADRALIVLSGPSRELSRKGFESGRYWLEEEADVVDVVAGDEPHERADVLSATVLFSNVTDVPRIDAMQAQAVEDAEPPTSGAMQFGPATRP